MEKNGMNLPEWIFSGVISYAKRFDQLIVKKAVCMSQRNRVSPGVPLQKNTGHCRLQEVLKIGYAANAQTAGVSGGNNVRSEQDKIERLQAELKNDCQEMPESVKLLKYDTKTTLTGTRKDLWEIVRKVLVGCPWKSPVANPIVTLLQESVGDEKRKELSSLLHEWTGKDWTFWSSKDVAGAAFDTDDGGWSYFNEPYTILMAITFFSHGWPIIVAGFVGLLGVLGPAIRVGNRLTEKRRLEQILDSLKKKIDDVKKDGSPLKNDKMRDEWVLEFLRRHLAQHYAKGGRDFTVTFSD